MSANDNNTQAERSSADLTHDELKAKIAELEDAGRFREAMPLKTLLSRPVPPPDAERIARDARRGELSKLIDELEAESRFRAAATLKTELSRLASFR